SVEFIGANGYAFGTYHSNYDARPYAERIADPGFTTGATLARVLGTLALRMANADALPFRFSNYAARLAVALQSVPAWRRDAAGQGVVTLDLAPLEARAAAVRQFADSLERAIDTRLGVAPLAPAIAASLNDRLARLEQQLADDDGAPDSRWYRHVFHGWNIYSLYDGQPFPGLAEAIRLRDQRRTDHELRRIARALDRMRDELTAALAVWRQAR